MGLFQELWAKIRGGEQEPEEEIPDEVTRDKYLRSLRRENRVLDEEEEKKYLIKKIAARRKLKLRKELFGIKDRIKNKEQEDSSFLGRHNL